MYWTNGTTQMECYGPLSKHHILSAFRFVVFKMQPLLIVRLLIMEICAYLPCFTDSRLSVARIPYQIAALVNYSGNDDNCKPVVWTILPEWFLYDVTHVWMIRL